MCVFFFRYAATKGKIVYWTRNKATGALSNFVEHNYAGTLCPLKGEAGTNDQFVSLAISPEGDGTQLYGLVTSNGENPLRRGVATNCPNLAQRDGSGAITRWHESKDENAFWCTSHYAGASQLYLFDRNPDTGALSNDRNADGACPANGQPTSSLHDPTKMNYEIGCRRIVFGHQDDLLDGKRVLYVSCNMGDTTGSDANFWQYHWRALHSWRRNSSTGQLSDYKLAAHGNFNYLNYFATQEATYHLITDINI